jgi:hypothetical protein
VLCLPLAAALRLAHRTKSDGAAASVLAVVQLLLPLVLLLLLVVASWTQLLSLVLQ